MKRKLQRIVLSLMCLVVCGMLSAEEFVSIGGLNYYAYALADNKNVAFLSGTTEECAGDVVIPESITSKGVTYSVTKMQDYSFSNSGKITSVTIPNSITEIETGLFNYMENLVAINVKSDNPNYSTMDGVLFNKDKTTLLKFPKAKVGPYTIPNTVTSLSPNAFRECKGLTSVTIPNGVTEIESYAFFGCSSLTSVTIPNNVTGIGSYAFSGCSSLTSVTIPNGVTSIGTDAFYGCTSLYEITNLSNLNIVARDYYGNGGIAKYAYVVRTSMDDPSAVIYQGDFVFKVTDSPVLVKYNGSATSLTLPTSCNGKKYTIGSAAFANNSLLKSVVIPNGVTSIGNSAFSSCSNLESVSIGSDIEEIGDNAFSCPKLTKAEYASMESLLRIKFSISGHPFSSFYDETGSVKTHLYIAGREITNVVIPNGFTSINDFSFFNCSSIISVSIPNSVTSIGTSAFCRCTSLTSVNIPNSVTSIGTGAFYNCTGLTSITIPNSVTSIDNNVFAGSGLTSITIPNSVTSIGTSAFWSCTSLTSVNIPNSVTSIGTGAFSYCTGLTSITIPNSVTSIDNNVFAGSGLISITIPNNIKTISDYAFYECTGLTSITIPSSVTSIGKDVFYGCSSLTSITIPSSITSISSKLFYGCTGLTSVTIPSSVTSIGGSAFRECSALASITIPNSVTSISSSAFEGCIGLTSVTIGKNVTYIDMSAFYNCYKLYEVYNLSGLNIIVGNSDNGYVAYYAKVVHKSLSEASLYYKTGGFLFLNTATPSLVAYTGSSSDIVLPGNCNGRSYEIAEKAFLKNPTIVSVTIPSGVTSIGREAFEDCKNLQSVSISGSLESVGIGAFSGCSSLTSVTLPSSMKSIPNRLFDGCTALTSITIPDGVEKIGSSVFYNCSALTSVVLPNSVTGIGSEAFGGCSALASIVIPNGVSSIYGYTFKDCTSLTSVFMPNSVTSIGNSAFENCSGLVSLVIPKSVTSIESSAFSGCEKLESLTLPEGLITLGNSFVTTCKDVYAPLRKIPQVTVSITGNLHVPNGSASTFRSRGWRATGIIEDQDVDYEILSNTFGNIAWGITSGGTLNITSTKGQNVEMASYYYTPTSQYESYSKAKDEENYKKYPWYEYRSSIKNIVVDKSVIALGWGCFYSMNNLESITTYTTRIAGLNFDLSGDQRNHLAEVFGREYISQTYSYGYYNNFRFTVPAKLSKIIYKGEEFKMDNFAGGYSRTENSSINLYAKFEEYHPANPLEIIADGVTSIVMNNSKALKNTKLYITYQGELKKGIFANLGDLYSLTLNGTGVASENGAFYTLFGTATTDNMDMMYGGGGYHIPKNLKEVHLMDDVTSIPQDCFMNVTSLEKIYLPSTLRGVQDNAFYNCDGLSDIYVNATLPPSAKDNTFDGVNLFLCKLHVPEDSKKYYSIAKGWKNFFFMEEDAEGPDAGKEKCAAPIVNYSNGKITCSSATPNAQCYVSYSIKGEGINTLDVNSNKIEITAYATAEGFAKSELVTKTFDYTQPVNCDINGDGKVTMADANAIVNAVLGK